MLIMLLLSRCVRQTMMTSELLSELTITDELRSFLTDRNSLIIINSSTSVVLKITIPSLVIWESNVTLNKLPYCKRWASICSWLWSFVSHSTVIFTWRDLIETDSTAFCLAKVLTHCSSIIKVTSNVLILKNSSVNNRCSIIWEVKEMREKIYAVDVLRTISKFISITWVKIRALNALR